LAADDQVMSGHAGLPGDEGVWAVRAVRAVWAMPRPYSDGV